MIQKITEVIIRSAIAYAVILILGRFIGRKLLSRITFFDFVVGVIFGSLAVRIALGEEYSTLLGVVSAVTITILVLLTELLNVKSSLFRKLEEGEPVLLIRQGKLLDENIKKAKMSISKLLMLLRQKDVFYIENVDFAIIESDGQLSVWLKPEKQPVTSGDLNVPQNGNKLPVDIIIDGRVIEKNLKSSTHNITWLKQQLNNTGAKNIEDVFYAALVDSDKLYVSAYNKNGVKQ